MNMTPELLERIRRVELLLLDVDGVLTDGSIVYGEPTLELKRFHVRDGSGIKMWQGAGKSIAIISGRNSPAVSKRAAELGIGTVIQGRAEKVPALREILATTKLDASQVVSIGDDLPDLPVLLSVGVGIAVADACAELRDSADYVTTMNGGHGAVRDAIEWLLKSQSKWDEVVERFRRTRM